MASQGHAGIMLQSKVRRDRVRQDEADAECRRLRSCAPGESDVSIRSTAEQKYYDWIGIDRFCRNICNEERASLLALDDSQVLALAISLVSSSVRP